MRKPFGHVALLVAFYSLAGASLSAQLQTGRLLGTVLDEQHAAVPGATVTVTNPATNISRTVTTDGEGNYVVTPLEPGLYRSRAFLPATCNVQTVRPEIVNGNVIGGISGQQTRFLLDGVDITEEHQGGTWIQTSVDALQEFSVQQNAYSAEGHGAGGTFNAITKSGSNVFRGSAFEFLRNDAFDAKNFFAAQKEH